MQLSKRLEACLHYTAGYQKLADIGTDHALLPIEAVARGNVLTALAIDNKFGPFIQARTNIKKYSVDNRVKAFMAEGLSKIDDEVDVVVISGMGGELIVRILSENEHKNVKRFILQANRDVPLVRRYMTSNGYAIIDEIILEEQNKTYEIVVFESGTMKLSDKEILFGPIHLQSRPYYFMKHYEALLQHYQSIIEDVNDSGKRHSLEETIQTLKEVLYDHS